jgi:hypothetical protein
MGCNTGEVAEFLRPEEVEVDYGVPLDTTRTTQRGHRGERGRGGEGREGREGSGGSGGGGREDGGGAVGHCVETGSNTGIFTREWSKASVSMDCNKWEATITMKKTETET